MLSVIAEECKMEQGVMWKRLSHFPVKDVSFPGMGLSHSPLKPASFPCEKLPRFPVEICLKSR